MSRSRQAGTTGCHKQGQAEMGHPLCTSRMCAPVTCRPEQVRGQGSGVDSGQAPSITLEGEPEFPACWPPLPPNASDDGT